MREVLLQAKNHITVTVGSIESDTSVSREESVSELEQLRDHLQEMIENIDMTIDSLGLELDDEEA